MIKLYTTNQYSLTPFLFYNNVLIELHEHYKREGNTPPIFSMIFPMRMFQMRMDPMVIPLIVSLGAYLKKIHGNPMELRLSNTPETNDLLMFLEKIDFFKVVGNVHDIPIWPKGRYIFEFDNRFIGNLNIPKDYRKEHKLRVYSPEDADINNILNLEKDEKAVRDKLLNYFSIIIDEDFGELFDDQISISENKILFNEILSELLTNSIYHGKTLVPAMMHTKDGKTTLAISDTGIGLKKSISNKENKFSSNKDLKQRYVLLNDENFSSIFDTLYYSFQNDRRGLFDLILLVVVKSDGIFRLHNTSCQLIISQRYKIELENLFDLREDIYYEKKKINADIKIINNILTKGYDLFEKIIEKTDNFYDGNIRFSTSRFNKVNFPGVHIEVEILNSEA